MSEKWMGFLAGITIALNIIVLALLAVPLGFSVMTVRTAAFGVIGLDTLIELIVFIFYKGGKKE